MLDLTIALWIIFLASFGLWGAGFVVGTTKIKCWFLLLAVWFPLFPFLISLRNNNITLPSITIIALPANDTIGLENLINVAITLMAMIIVFNLGILIRLLAKRIIAKRQLVRLGK